MALVQKASMAPTSAGISTLFSMAHAHAPAVAFFANLPVVGRICFDFHLSIL